MGWRVVCGECGARYSVSDDAAERRLRCRECGEPVEAIAKKGKKRRGQPDLGIRIFGGLGVLLTAANLFIAAPVLFFGAVFFKLIGIAIAIVYLGLCVLAIRAASGKSLPITRAASLEGTNAIVGGILLSIFVTLCNPVILWAGYQVYNAPRRSQPVAQVTPPSSAAHASPPSTPAAHTTVPAPAAPRAAADPPQAMSLTLNFKSFKGPGDPVRAADNATRGVGGVARVLRVNPADGEIVMLLAGGRFQTGDVTTALQNAGFEMGPGLRIGPVEPNENSPRVVLEPIGTETPSAPPVAASPPGFPAPPPQPQVDPNATHAIELKFNRYQGIGPPELVANRQLVLIPYFSRVLLLDEPQHRLVLQLRYGQQLPPWQVVNFRELEGAGFELERDVQVGVWNAETRRLQSPQQITVPNIAGGSSGPPAPDEFDMRMQFNERSPETLKKIREAVPKVKGVQRIVQVDGNMGVAVVRIKRRICDPSEVVKAMQSAGIQSVQTSFEPVKK